MPKTAHSLKEIAVLLLVPKKIDVFKIVPPEEKYIKLHKSKDRT